MSLTPPSPQEKRSHHRTFRMARKRWLTVPESRPPTTRRSGSAGGRARVGPTPAGGPQERGPSPRVGSNTSVAEPPSVLSYTLMHTHAYSCATRMHMHVTHHLHTCMYHTPHTHVHAPHTPTRVCAPHTCHMCTCCTCTLTNTHIRTIAQGSREEVSNQDPRRGFGESRL